MDKREEWLKQRRNYIGASDVAAILGLDPRRGQMHVWASKVHGYSEKDKRSMLVGRLTEKLIGKIYNIETDRDILGDEDAETSICVHPDFPWLGATLDDVTQGSDKYPAPFEDVGPLELKNTSGFVNVQGAWKRIKPHEWEEFAPMAYRIQTQIQMACLGSQWGSLAALFSNNTLAWFDMERHDRVLNAIYPKLETFWKLVETKTPPPLGELPVLDVVKAVYNEETGETMEFTEDQEKVVLELQELRSSISASEKVKKALEAEVRVYMKDKTFGKIPSTGTYVTLKTTHRKGYTRVIKPGKFRTLGFAKKI